jgi:hypothetical protein
MPPRKEGYVDHSDRRPDQCFAAWNGRHGVVACPNDYTHVIETLHAPGYMQVCTPHNDGFAGAFDLRDAKVWTRADWEAAGRRAQLDAQLQAQQN